MSNRLELVGKRFGRLVVIRLSQAGAGKTFFWCRCDCGNEKEIRGSYLVNGDTQSCGCLHKEAVAKVGRAQKKNHPWRKKTYNCWRAMMDRCYNPNNSGYADYGGRGITVEEEWHDVLSFFIDMGNAPLGMQIERKNNDGNYCKANCCWATRKEQQRNRRNTFMVEWEGKMQPFSKLCEEFGVNYETAYSRYHSGKSIPEVFDQTHHEYFRENNPRSKYITYNGETKRVGEWAEQFGMGVTTLNYRIKNGWTMEEALTTPASKHNKLRNIRG